MSEPIKVLAIVHDMRRGGLETRLMDVIRNIDSSRIRIDVFTWSMEKGYYDEEVEKLGGTIYYNQDLNVKNIFRYVRIFRDFLKEHPEYRIVHAHQDYWCSVFCKGAYLAGVPARIAQSETAISGFSLEYVVKNLIKLPAKRYANYYFAVSEKAGRWLFGNRLYHAGKVRIWKNAFDVSKFCYDENRRIQVRTENGWKDKYVVMHVGNFMPAKNHPFLLRIFRSIAETDPEAILVLVGEGKSQKIEDFIRSSKLEKRVCLLGTRDDVDSLLQAADVFLFPSLFEGLPGAVMEAQAAGLPCVISDVITKEVCVTHLVEMHSLQEDINIWRDAVLRYKGKKRTNTTEDMEKSGFEIQAMVKKLESFYEQIYKNNAEVHKGL